MAEKICFVIMPFGVKKDRQQRNIDFDQVYQQIIAPAAAGAGLQPLRADQEASSGIIHKEMFERLLLAPWAIVDISILNANVYYELGVRHALCRRTTVIVGAAGAELPFDLAALRLSSYHWSGGRLNKRQEDCQNLQAVLQAGQEQHAVDSPLFQLLDLPTPDISRLKTDLFRQQAQAEIAGQEQLAAARAAGKQQLLDAVADLGAPQELSATLATDALLSLRAVQAWPELVAFSQQVSPELAATALFGEQRALALARDGHYQQASELLLGLIAERGPSSESYGILGGIYKRRWQQEQQPEMRAGYLQQAIDAYYQGFICDWRDAYPGINFLTLSFCHQPWAEKEQEVSTLVSFAQRQRLNADPDFWDYSTGLELAALEVNEYQPAILAQSCQQMREPWEGASAASNLQLIAARRQQLGSDDLPWLSAALAALQQRSAELVGTGRGQ